MFLHGWFLSSLRATIKVQEMMGTVGNGSGLSAFERMEEKGRLLTSWLMEAILHYQIEYLISSMCIVFNMPPYVCWALYW